MPGPSKQVGGNYSGGRKPVPLGEPGWEYAAAEAWRAWDDASVQHGCDANGARAWLWEDWCQQIATHTGLGATVLREQLLRLRRGGASRVDALGAVLDGLTVPSPG